MELNRPRVLKLRIRRLKIQARLDAILREPNKRNDPLLIEPSRIGNRLQEDIIQPIHLCAMLGRLARGFVDGLEADTAALAGQLGADLEPQAVEALLDGGDVGAGQRHVRPRPAVVVHVDEHRQPARYDLVHHVLDPLQPRGVHVPGRRLGNEVVRPGHGQSHALEARGFDVVEG